MTFRPDIGGYAVQFDTPHPIARDERELVRRGAFRAFLAEGWNVDLFVNHWRHLAPNASTSRGTLRLEEDAYGLWFEAMMLGGADTGTFDSSQSSDRLYSNGARIVGMSPRISYPDGPPPARNGLRVYAALNLVEISLIAEPNTPAWGGTWAAPYRRALARRPAMPVPRLARMPEADARRRLAFL